MFEDSQKDYLMSGHGVRRWIDENIVHKDRGLVFLRFLNKPFVPYMVFSSLYSFGFGHGVIQNMIGHIIKKLHDERGRLDLVVGAKGSGKTCLAFYLAERLHKKYNEKIIWFGPPVSLPSFMKTVMNFEDIPVNSTTILDEASVRYFSRGGQEDQNVIRMLPVQRHSGRNFILVTQSTAISDLNFVRMANSIFFKSFATFQSETERFKLSDELKIFMPTKRPEVLYYDNESILNFKFNLPECWKEEYSFPYASFRDDAELYRFILYMIKQKVDTERIALFISLRNKSIDNLELTFIRMLVEFYGVDKFLNLDDDELVKAVKSGFDDTPLGVVSANINKFEFDQTPLQWEMTKRESEKSELFDLYSRRNINKIIEIEIGDRLKKTMNLIVSIYGQTGTGKSYASLSLAEYIKKIVKKLYDIEPKIYVEFLVEELLKDIEKANKFDIFILDEAINQFGIGSGRSVQELENIENVMRKRQLVFFFNSPEVKCHLHHFVLRTHAICYDKKVSKLLVYNPKKFDNDLIGYITLKIPSEELVREYEKKKDAFLDIVQKRSSSSKDYLVEMAKEIMKHKGYDEFTKSEKLSYIQSVYPNFTTTEQTFILDWTSIMEKKSS